MTRKFLMPRLPMNARFPLFSAAAGAWMLRARGALLVLLAACCLPLVHAQELLEPDVNDGQTFRVIAMHDVVDDLDAPSTMPADATRTATRDLADFLSWLQTHDYHPVSLQRIVDARNGGAPLPDRAVLLSFDDGYASFYSRAYPLLKQFGYPAVLALVTSWLEVPANGQVEFGNTEQPRDAFLSWAQIKEMADSGLIELASHSHAMHTGIQANPQGNLIPAAVSHAYDPQTGRYETDAQYQARIEGDLRHSRSLIEQRTGHAVRTMVWPYGAYNQFTLAAARAAGMPITMTLMRGPNNANTPLAQIRRALASYDSNAASYQSTLLRLPEGQGARPINRAMHIDLDYVYDPDPVQQETNLSRLLDRIQAIGPTSVFLQAYADPDGDGEADALYFPNRHLPVRADLFNRVAWQIKTRTGAQVYAWMPVLAFHLPAEKDGSLPRVQALTGPAKDGRYARLSPFSAEARRVIGEIYDDLGRYTQIGGVLFHDDATLGDDEDNSEPALKTYAGWGLPADLNAIRQDPALSSRWAQAKTRYLTDFTLELADILKRWQPELITARNLYAKPLLDPAAAEWMSQDYENALAAYDYVAVMAMPYMEGQPGQAQADAWLRALARRALATPDGVRKTLFELQARDWREGGGPLPDATLERQWLLLKRMGIRHFAYYPDDFVNDQPGVPVLRNMLSRHDTLQGLLPGSEPVVAPAQPATNLNQR